MMKQVRLGIIGLGRFAEQHLKCIQEMPFVKVVAVCDLVSQRSDDIASGLNCNGYSNWEEMLQKEELDAVDVLTPEFAHAEPVLAALQSGCHVFVEKPFALLAQEAEQMLRTAEILGKVLMVGHVCRFDVRYVQVKKALKEGRLGDLRSLYARRNNVQKFLPLYRRAHPIFILGIHDIDLMLWLTESEVTEVFARSTNNSDGDCDLVWSMFKFKNGVIGVIENNWLLPNRAPAYMDAGFEIVGYSGTAKVQEPDQSLVFLDRTVASTPPLLSGFEIYGRVVGPLFEELHHFFTCVAKNQPSEILKPADALRAVQIAEAVIRSCEKGVPIQLDDYKTKGDLL